MITHLAASRNACLEFRAHTRGARGITIRMRTRVRKGERNGDALVICAVALCFLITLSLCLLMDGSGFLAVSRESESAKYYLLCGGAYEDISLARNYAELIRSRGGAGYVLQGERCEVVLGVYASEEKANEALGASGMQGAYISEIAVATGTDGVPRELKDEAVAALGYFPLVLDEFTSLADGVADARVSLADAKVRLGVLSAKLGELKEGFYSASEGVSSAAVTELKLALVTAAALVETVDFGSPSGTESAAYAAASLRYQSVQLVLSRQALGSSLAG